MHRSLLLALMVLLVCSSARAGDPDSLRVAEPPAGPLPPDRLAQIAEDVRRLEAHPLAPDAMDARRVLFTWLQASPDVDVTVCPAAVSPLVDLPHSYKGDLLTQFVLSSAATVLEAAPAGGTMQHATGGGLRGVLAAYRTLQEVDEEMERHAFLEMLGSLDDAGLDAFVAGAVVVCEQALLDASAPDYLPLAPSAAVLTDPACEGLVDDSPLAICDPVFEDIDVFVGTLRTVDGDLPFETGGTAFVLDSTATGTALSLVARLDATRQLEVNHLLVGPGVFAVEQGQAFLFELGEGGEVVRSFTSTGSVGDVIGISVYDPVNGTLKGWLSVTLSEDGAEHETVTFPALEFAVVLTP
jgi:hypothetical protein